VKEVAAAAASLLTFAIFVPCALGIVRGRLRPSAASWSIWAFGTALVAGAQFGAGAGVGAAPLALSASVSLGIAILAARAGGGFRATRIDLASFLVALAAGLAWCRADDARVAVVLLTAIDLVGFVPMLRRSWSRPQDESASFYALGALRNIFVLLALEAWNLVTVLFPLAVGIACLGVAGWLLARRRALS